MFEDCPRVSEFEGLNEIALLVVNCLSLGISAFVITAMVVWP